MKTRGQAIGGNNNLIRAPHIAPGARCNNVIQLAGESPSAFAIGCTVPMQEMTVHSFRSSMQTGTNPSLGLFASVVARSHGEESTSHLLSTRAALKLSQFADAVFEVAKAFLLFLMCLFGGAVISGSILCWLFLF